MTTQECFRELGWDSQNFGIRTGIITKPTLKADELSAILDKVRRNRYRLVYFPAVEPIKDHDFLAKYGGLLVDEKLTYSKQIESTIANFIHDHIHPYTAHKVSPELSQLAFTSALYSRFKMDPHFAKEEYKTLYRIWIERSVSREIAHEVLVYEHDQQLLGFITLGEKNHIGDIGLIAVSAIARGRGIGRLLLLAAENDFGKRGFKATQVVTQGANRPAVRLYEKSGFNLVERSYYYHFWLS